MHEKSLASFANLLGLGLVFRNFYDQLPEPPPVPATVETDPD